MRAFASIFGVAVVLNYGWELLQAPLFYGMRSWQDRWWHCFLASLADGLLVVLIAMVGCVVLRNHNWYRQPGIQAYVLMGVTGFAIAVVIEKLALSTNRWSYSNSMPLIPFLEVGIAPVLQMVLLPPAVFRIASSKLDEIL